MINEKERLLQQYYQYTRSMEHALAEGKDEDVFQLLEDREQCIAGINQIDEQAGAILMNEQIQEQLEEQMVLEKRVQKALQQAFVRLRQRMRATQNEVFLTKQYEDSLPVSKGIFYDSKK